MAVSVRILLEAFFPFGASFSSGRRFNWHWAIPRRQRHQRLAGVLIHKHNIRQQRRTIRSRPIRGLEGVDRSASLGSSMSQSIGSSSRRRKDRWEVAEGPAAPPPCSGEWRPRLAGRKAVWRLGTGKCASCVIEITEGASNGLRLLPFPRAGSGSAVGTFEFGARGSQRRPPVTCGMSALPLSPPGCW